MVTKLQAVGAKKLHSVSNLVHERSSWQRQRVVCGVDEVGRGCLAGPVVAAAVVFPIGAVIDGVKDSKDLSKKALICMANSIKKTSWWGIGLSSNTLIDSCNIRVATQVAMRRALGGLFSISPLIPEKILIDAMALGLDFYPDIPQISAPKGESWSYSIAAASIIAKVWQDQLMEEYDKNFPQWGFGLHKGYGTSAHQQVLLSKEKSIIHRDSFLGKINSKEQGQQCSFL